MLPAIRFAGGASVRFMSRNTGNGSAAVNKGMSTVHARQSLNCTGPGTEEKSMASRNQGNRLTMWIAFLFVLLTFAMSPSVARTADATSSQPAVTTADLGVYFVQGSTSQVIVQR